MSEWEEFAAYRGIIADAKREERIRAYTIFQKHIGQLLWQSRQGTEIDMTPMFNELMDGNE